MAFFEDTLVILVSQVSSFNRFLKLFVLIGIFLILQIPRFVFSLVDGISSIKNYSETMKCVT